MKSVPVAVAIIRNKTGKILLTQRYDPEAPSVHMKWQLPGGGIEKNESAANACVREALEETNLKIQLETILPYVIKKVYERRLYVLNGFKAKVISGTINVERDEETHDCKWFRRHDIDGLDLMEDTIEMIDGCL